jgi:uncharacterized membrane protein
VVWIVVAALAVWVLVQQQRLSALSDRLTRLSLDLAALAARGTPAPTHTPEASPAKASPPEAPPVLAEVVAPGPAVAERSEPPLSPTVPVPAPPPPVGPRPEAADLSETPPPPAPGPSIADWLSENGLAWIGGGALALGGLLLVAYAAQQGFFTPALRIAAAITLGLGALGVGEALRRGVWARSGPNLLVAALTTAAGAATLYAAVWAASLLYHFIPIATAGALLTAVSVGLLALALLHGEPLGILAILAAYLVPVVARGGGWTDEVLDAFIFLILATGTAASGLRRWARAGLTALAGAAVWSLARLAADDTGGAAFLLAAAPALSLGAVALAPKRAGDEAGEEPLFALTPVVAVVGACILSFFLWPTGRDAGARDGALSAAVIIAIVGLGVRLRRLPPGLLAAPAALAVLAALVMAHAQAVQIVWLLPTLAALALAAFTGAERGPAGRAGAVAGGVGTALSLTIAAQGLAGALPGWDWSIDAGFSALFAIGAVVLARRSREPESDLTPAVFIAAAAETLGLALHAILDGRAAPTGYGLLGLLLAALAVRVRWRGFAESAAVAALFSFASLLAPPIAGAALEGTGSWPVVATAAGAAALAQFATWRVLKARPDVPGCSEAVSTAALLSALLGAFLVIQIWGRPQGDGPTTLDPFAQASLRTLLLLAAGLVLALRGAATRFGRLRAPALLTLGTAHGLILQGLVLNPWWGPFDAPVTGPPGIDGLLLGLLAPALILLDVARRPGLRVLRLSRPAVGAALAFVVLWLLGEIRRLFHGPNLTQGPMSYAEIAAYADAALALALGLDAVRERLTALAAASLAVAIDAAAWIAQVLALWLLGYIASPWWGPLDGDLAAPLPLAILYLAGCLFSARLAQIARAGQRPAMAKAALVSAGVEAFAALTLAVRYGFHGAAMRAPLREASVETWTFSAVWAVYGLALLAAGASRRDVWLRGLGLAVLLTTTLKVFLFDLARLEGPIRAASFLALGAVLLLGALAARRFAAAARRNEP